MKNVCFSLAFMLIGSFAFANTKEVKKETSKQLTSKSIVATKSIGAIKERTVVVYCGGKRKGFLTCDCTDAQFQSMANTMCNP